MTLRTAALMLFIVAIYAVVGEIDLQVAEAEAEHTLIFKEADTGMEHMDAIRFAQLPLVSDPECR